MIPRGLTPTFPPLPRDGTGKLERGSIVNQQQPCAARTSHRRYSSFAFAPFVALVFILLAGGAAAQLIREDPNVEIVGHRGASHEAPENTLSSVMLSWQENADATEIDVYLTADNRVVLFHDKEMKRTTGAPGMIWEQTTESLAALEAGAWKHARWAGEPIPFIEPVIESIPDHKRLFIEIKCGTEIVPHLVPIIRESGKRPEQISIISFQYDVCVEMKKALPEHQVYFLSSFKEQPDGTLKPTIDELIQRAKDGNLDGLDLSFKGLNSAEDVQKIKDAGLFVATWTVNDPEVARRMIEYGVESITTDRPAGLRQDLSAAGS